MKSVLLVIGGIVQVLIMALHIGMFWGIAANPDMVDKVKVVAHIFNAAVLCTVMFFAFVSLFMRQDLVNTRLGRVVCWFIAVFYLQRGVVEVIVRDFNPGSFALFVIIAGLYIVTGWPDGSRRPLDGRVTAGTAPSPDQKGI